MSPLRIAVGVVVLGLVAGAALWAAGRESPALPPEPAAPTPPVMDIADPSVRRVLLSLSGERPKQFNGRWLGERCREGAGEQYEFARWDFGNYSRQRALVVLDGDRGRFHFDARALDDPEVMRLGRSWALDARQVQRVRALLRASGYPRLPAAGPQDGGYCHQPWVSVESCIDGHYFGLSRMCEGMPDVDQQGPPPRPVNELVEGLDALMREASDGETARQLGRVASPRLPGY